VSHRRHHLIASLLLILPSFVPIVRAGDTTIAAYRSNASEVRVTFFATDNNNHPIDRIEKEDFAIVDGNLVVRDFRSLTRSDETALDVVVLVDTSGSVATRFPMVMTDVLRLISQKEIAKDEDLSVVSFSGTQPAVLCARDCRNPEMDHRLLSVKPRGPTPLYDAIVFGADLLSRQHRHGVRPVLIVLSDGDDTISKASLQDALRSVIASGALLYAVDLKQTDNEFQRSVILQRLAGDTGGRYLPTEKNVADLLHAVLEDSRNTYVVTYQLPNQTIGFHSLRILPRHNLNLRFYCRSGYYYDNEH